MTEKEAKHVTPVFKQIQEKSGLLAIRIFTMKQLFHLALCLNTFLDRRY
jgi:hypothetical protein